MLAGLGILRDADQGSSENCSEAYLTYVERNSELLTQICVEECPNLERQMASVQDDALV